MFTQTMQTIRVLKVALLNQSNYGKETRYVYSYHAGHKIMYVQLLNQSTYGKETRYVYSNHADHRSTECSITQSIQLWEGDQVCLLKPCRPQEY